MMDCAGALALLERWEAGGGIGGEELEGLAAHAAGCPACAARHAALLPLLRRDAGIPAPASGRSAPLADAVMGRIASGNLRPSRGSLRVHRAPSGPDNARVARTQFKALGEFVRVRAASLAAAAILAVAIGSGLYLGLRDRDSVVVRFVLDAPEASSVAVAGDFNGWKTEGWALSRRGAGAPWELSIRLRKGGFYAYNFVVDGERWIPDPAIPERVDDGFGGSSSLLRL